MSAERYVVTERDVEIDETIVKVHRHGRDAKALSSLQVATYRRELFSETKGIQAHRHEVRQN